MKIQLRNGGQECFRWFFEEFFHQHSERLFFREIFHRPEDFVKIVWVGEFRVPRSQPLFCFCINIMQPELVSGNKLQKTTEVGPIKLCIGKYKATCECFTATDCSFPPIHFKTYWKATETAFQLEPNHLPSSIQDCGIFISLVDLFPVQLKLALCTKMKIKSCKLQT